MTSIVYRTFAGIAMFMALLIEPVACHAGLLDWMFPGRNYPYGVFYPNYYNAYGGAYNPYYSAGYSPYAAYGTSWTANPTTVFTPVTTPTATLMQPTSTYTWQAQRIPYYSLQPAVPWTAAPSCGSAVPYSAGYPAMNYPTAAYPAGAAWQTLGSTTVASPAVGIPATVALPSAPIVSNYYPSATIAPPSTISPSCGYGSAGYGSAADFAPTLNSTPTISNYPSSNYYSSPSPATTYSPSCPNCVNSLSIPNAGISSFESSSDSGGFSASPWEPVSTTLPPANGVPSASEWQAAPAGTTSIPGTGGGSTAPADSRPQIDPSINMNSTGMRPTAFIPATRPDAWSDPMNTRGYVPTQGYVPIPDAPGSSSGATSPPPSSGIQGWPQNYPTTQPSFDRATQTASNPNRPWQAIPIHWPSIAERNPPWEANNSVHDHYRPRIPQQEGNWRQAQP